MKNIDTTFSPRALALVLQRLGISSATSLTLAFSGGLDSLVLLHALCALRVTLSLRLRAVHVDHGLQPASADWSRQVEETCRRWQVPCSVERVHVSGTEQYGLEAAARSARYASLARHLTAGDVLLTAHHIDDQAETVLLQLLRGTGVQGLAAIQELTDFSAGRLARPLLGFNRSQLSAYAQREKLQWIDDASNQDRRFARNYLRHEIFPLLARRWPAAASQIARSAGLAAEAAGLLDSLAEADWQICRLEGRPSLSVRELRELPAPRQRNLVRYWLRRRGFRAPSALHLEQVLAQVTTEPRSHYAVIRWPEAEVCRYRDELAVRRPSRETDSARRWSWNPTEPLDIPGVGMLLAEAVLGDGLSRERIGNSPLTVGLRQGGEVCRLPGRVHRHKLKKLLQEAGVPPWLRRQLPLVYANGELVAIGDRWVCEPYVARVGEPAWKLRLEYATEFSE